MNILKQSQTSKTLQRTLPIAGPLVALTSMMVVVAGSTAVMLMVG